MATERNDASSIWTAANVVTLVRICLVPIFVIALLSPWPEWFGVIDVITNSTKALIATGVFIVISCTDWIDGYLARSRGEVTDFGKFLDPLADKILVAAALIALVELQVIPSWPVLIILTREFIVSGIRMVAASKGHVIAASWYGKAKTVFQILAIVLFLIKDSITLSTFDAVVHDPLYIISWAVMIIALVLTILSMLDYIAKAQPLLFPKKGVEQSLSETDAFSVEYEDTYHLAESVLHAASSHGMKIATAESLTGGMIASALTAVPGSSEVVTGGAVTYINSIKHKVLGVNDQLLDDCGAVNEEVALEMANGALSEFNADIAVSVTGIAGPGGAEEGKPVGTVFMGVAYREKSFAKRYQFQGDREEIRMKTVQNSLKELLKVIQNFK